MPSKKRLFILTKLRNHEGLLSHENPINLYQSSFHEKIIHMILCGLLEGRGLIISCLFKILLHGKVTVKKL